MKTEFSFPFESQRLFLESDEEIKLKLSWGEDVDSETSTEEAAGHAEAVLRIVREVEKDSRLSGYIKCTVPGEPEKALPLAQMLVSDFVELLKYLGEDTLSLVGLIHGTRIAESPEEEAQIGEHTGWMNVSIKEVPPPLRFSREILRLYPHSKPVMHQLRQFNLGSRAPNPVDKYLALFKILESKFASPKGKMKVHDLVANQEFRSLVEAAIVFEDANGTRQLRSDEVDDLIKDLVVVRHKCAHLRDPEVSGYWPTHPEISEKVEGLAEIVADLVRESVKQRLDAECKDLAESIGGGFYL